jgi:NADH-quinone oxidoreductase subunit G
MITLTINDTQVTVPDGTLIVNAARKIGNAIPVFCYHPKMEPVGMCRMCLVDVGRPMMDRVSGQPVLDDNGKPKIQFGPKLETACTTPVSQGMVVVTNSPKVAAARKEVVEFILTSHPLDCPICDKGGECSLQNLTLDYGAGTSRFLYDEKMHLEKNVPLSDLIFLDRERCIQCGRCVRFQHEVVDDPVINFYQRGRSMEIVTFSEPGFDSIWSGNTTDICPVGALTSADFHFRSRPWEMRASASVCNQCPVGCNIVYNTRREAKSDGRIVIKRVMPRQNESVNEIWICDKGRFSYHYNASKQRLNQPLVRKEGKLQPASWDEALGVAAQGLKEAGMDFLALAGGQLANEDLFNLRQLAVGLGGKALLHTYMAGGDLTAQLGVGEGTNFGAMGKGNVILVVASDLHEEAPVWWLRIKQAAKRGAQVIVVNPRPTRLDAYAAHVVRYAYGDEATTIQGFLDSKDAAALAFASAEKAVILFGSDGLDLAGSGELAQACADLLVKTGHMRNADTGLIGVWHACNLQGAWDIGWRPTEALDKELAVAKAVLIAGVDPVGDDPALADAFEMAGFVVVQELFLTETAQMADVVLPVQAQGEREGTYTSGERRVQRFYPAVNPLPGTQADYIVSAQLGHLLGLSIEDRGCSLVLLKIADAVRGYAGLTYPRLAETAEKYPLLNTHDLFFGGTTYANHQGLGVQLASQELASQRNQSYTKAIGAEKIVLKAGELLLVPVTRLYDRGTLLAASPLLQAHLEGLVVTLNPLTAGILGITAGQKARLNFNGFEVVVEVALEVGVPQNVVLLPRSVGLPVSKSACRLAALPVDIRAIG